MSITLALLPADAAAPLTRLHVDAHGNARLHAVGSEQPAAATQTVLVVPGADVHLRWMRVPGRSIAQSVAAARLQLAEHLAVDGQALHVVIADQADSDGERLVAAVDADIMRHWLERAAALGIVPDCVAPDCLLLPEAAPGQPLTLVGWDGRWLMRGRRLACSLEPSLAAVLLAALPQAPQSPQEDPQHAIAHFARHAASVPINLRQQGFAVPTPQRARGSRRMLAWLTGLLLVSPVLLMVAQNLRYEIGAQRLQRAVAQLPGATADSGRRGASTAARGANQPGAFAAQLAALFSAVDAVPGAALDALVYQDGRPLRVTVWHSDAAQLEHITAPLSRAGWQLRPGTSQTQDDRMQTPLELEPPR
ncbi:type II secretion system protein GspL [Xanthomonas cannabis]|uniref:type II secretion system protein GspL n=1 Tax=Xanthomonas cannabis TaxID=1885674 RepID=UPI00057324BA|nr:type II secretion system protein GspL [Xanthomonas cannabis]KHL52415.1 type II secretion system protein L [Xanthomonas cannabis pv. cannabis]